jgi:hypothetical protein
MVDYIHALGYKRSEKREEVRFRTRQMEISSGVDYDMLENYQ